MTKPKKDPAYNLPCNRCKKPKSSPFKNYPCLECRKDVVVYFQCPGCKRPHTTKYMGLVCAFCYHDPAYVKELKKADAEEKKHGSSFYFQRYSRDPVAFGVDKRTGREYAIDKKGQKFDPDSTRYNLKRDPHGWKATDAK